jgi:hypothetical protein
MYTLTTLTLFTGCDNEEVCLNSDCFQDEPFKITFSCLGHQKMELAIESVDTNLNQVVTVQFPSDQAIFLKNWLETLINSKDTPKENNSKDEATRKMKALYDRFDHDPEYKIGQFIKDINEIKY